MMHQDRVALQFCGFGGQGIVLLSVVLGTAAVTRGGLYAVQTQSYGSEARGGECQAELILSKDLIRAPLTDRVDILVAMSQLALNRYLGRLRSGGTLIIDPELVQVPDRADIRILLVPATEIASRIGGRIAANMVMLGFLQGVMSVVTEEDLLDTIRDHVPHKYLELNLEAARQGIALARVHQIQGEW